MVTNGLCNFLHVLDGETQYKRVLSYIIQR